MAVQPTSFSDTDSVRGIDVSHHNGDINWPGIASAGIKFCYVKATEGSGVKDIRFHEYYDASKAARLLSGAYHFFRPGVDAEAQAETFLHVVPELTAGDLPPALDVEIDDGQTAHGILDGVQQWLEAVENVLGHRPIIYTSRGFWNAITAASARFSDYMLWVAHYTTASSPRLPAGFSDYVIWQFTEQGRISGVDGNFDLDRFNGSEDDLNALAVS
jgi:lysozyme